MYVHHNNDLFVRFRRVLHPTSLYIEFSDANAGRLVTNSATSHCSYLYFRSMFSLCPISIVSILLTEFLLNFKVFTRIIVDCITVSRFVVNFLSADKIFHKVHLDIFEIYGWLFGLFFCVLKFISHFY